jgi:hypothetical protein
MRKNITVKNAPLTFILKKVSLIKSIPNIRFKKLQELIVCLFAKAMLKGMNSFALLVSNIYANNA